MYCYKENVSNFQHTYYISFLKKCLGENNLMECFKWFIVDRNYEGEKEIVQV